MEKKTYFITTPIYYPSGKWHLGHCYTTVICDAIARFKRMDNFDVFFLTGTDEHGQKIEQRASEKNETPKKFVDTLVGSIKDLWSLLDISYDKFIRTTDDYHVKAVQKIFKTLYDKGEIYKSEYEGLYCTPCESFWTESQLVNGKCPDCGRAVEKAKEESYFFKLSKYQDRLLKLYADNPNFIQPKSRMNEMINFIKTGLQDLAVSRTSFKWGIPVEFDPNHVVYVWIDALTNYINALGYTTDDTKLYEKYWPADLHMVGKEIVRFHTIIWPALLMALEIPLPKQVYGHGWLLIGGDKMSKSKGNVVDPFVLSQRYSVDAIRYFLLREVPFGNDGVYTNEALINRTNTDLTNSLGNLLSRTTAMIKQSFDSIVPKQGDLNDLDLELVSLAEQTLNAVRDDISQLSAPDALTDIFKLINRANKYIDETTPWALAKDPSQRDRLATVLYNLVETLRFVGVLLLPFIPKTAEKILNEIGITKTPTNFDSLKKFGVLKAGTPVYNSEKLFPRLDLKKELLELENLSQEKPLVEEKPIEKVDDGLIDIDYFSKVQLCTAKVLNCEKVKKSEKLLKLTLEVGSETRTVVSGIALSYQPDYLIGKTVVIVKNLKPAKLCGIESQGMILCGEKDGKIVFVTPEVNLDSGSEVR